MKVMKKILIVLISVLIMTACSSDKPSSNDVENAVMTEMQKGVPERWVNAMVKGVEPSIDKIEIVEWGKYNEDQKTWPVKVHVVGSATLAIPFGRPEKRSFDAVGDFYFHKDDFDKWQWQFIRPGLFGD